MNTERKSAALLVNWRVKSEPRLSRLLAEEGGWDVRAIGGAFPERITRLNKVLIAWPAYLLVPLKVVLGPRRDYLIAWQQVYGLVLALIARAMPWRFSARICVLSFIVVPSKQIGLARRIIEFALGSSSLSAAVCYNQAEVAHYRKVFPKAAHKIVLATLAEEVPDIERFEVRDDGYFVAAGRSNRDYEFLVRVFAGKPDFRLVIISDQFSSNEPLPGNVEVQGGTFGVDYFNMLAHARAVVMSFKDATISSGQLVFLHACQFGKPVLVTESSCLEGYVFHEQNGLVVSKDAVAFERGLELLADQEVYARLRERSRQIYWERFSVRQLARRIVDLMEPNRMQGCQGG